MSDRDTAQRSPKQPGSFRHPEVVSVAVRSAAAAAPGIQEQSDIPAETAEYEDILNVSPPRAGEAIAGEPLAQRMSRRLLEKRGAAS